MTTYCEAAQENPHHKTYHDRHYGFPIRSDADLFERLILEINQAGLSWLTILKKQENFRTAYRGFEIDRVAAFTEKDRTRLLGDPGIIRNRLKVDAAIHNARVLQGLIRDHGSFADWLDLHHPLPKEAWVKLFKKHFKFTGGEIVGEFLMSIGYLPGAHHEHCPVYQKIAKLNPPWMATIRR
ncbi:MAG: DNA-3-methyladenine glycosylase I [Verrucomicrobia bacterium]|nr:DNA-3-methyladenine glycosylase I [Kiritimatiellia bacterium]MCP5489072.1 DNA-3-methyladenine glycosylase I [Verrucomicrobiota bacterium]